MRPRSHVVTFSRPPAFNGGTESRATAPQRGADIMQDRILEHLTRDGILAGTLDDLANRFGAPSDDLRACLRQMADAGTIAVQTQPGDYLTVRPERRASRPIRASRDRRRLREDAWRL